MSGNGKYDRPGSYTSALSLIILLCCSFHFSFAQHQVIDSLKSILPKLKGIDRIECLNELGFEYSNPYWSRSKHIATDTARLYTEMALKESLGLNYEPGWGKAYQNIGMIEEEYGHINKSEYYTRQAIPILAKYDRKPELHRANINLAYCHLVQGRYSEGREICQKELEYYYFVNDMPHVSMIYRMIAHTYNNEGLTKLAFENYLKDFELEKNSNDILGILYSPTNKANLYLAAGDTPNAIINYRLSAVNTSSLPIRPEHYYSKLAIICKLQHKPDSALYYLRRNIEVINRSYRDTLARDWAYTQNAVGLAEIFLLQKQYDSTLYYAHLARKRFEEGNDMGNWFEVIKIIVAAYLQIPSAKDALYFVTALKNKAETLKARVDLLDAYQLLWSYYNTHDAREALKYKNLYAGLKKNLSDENYVSRISTIDLLAKMKIEEDRQIKEYQLNEKIKEARIKQMEKENRLQLIIFILSILLILLVIGNAIKNLKNKRHHDRLLMQMKETEAKLEKKKTEELLSEMKLQRAELEMKALKAQMNPHFISNSLNAINLFILQNDKEQASAYLTKFARLIRMILRHSESTHVELDFELETLHLYLELETLRFGDHFDFQIDIDPDIDTRRTKIPPLLLQPYVENAIWHGLMHKEEKGHLSVNIRKEEQLLVCSILDDGIGRKKAKAFTARRSKNEGSMGTRITSDMIALLKKEGQNTLHITINDLVHPDQTPAGTEVILKIPFVDD